MAWRSLCRYISGGLIAGGLVGHGVDKDVHAEVYGVFAAVAEGEGVVATEPGGGEVEAAVDDAEVAVDNNAFEGGGGEFGEALAEGG